MFIRVSASNTFSPSLNSNHTATNARAYFQDILPQSKDKELCGMWHSALKGTAAISLLISRTQKPAVIKKVNINFPLNPFTFIPIK